MTLVHQCKSMEAAELWFENNHNECVLNINHVATEQDLEENHYLEEAGEATENIAINVLFCPYCGEKLNKNQTTITPDFKYTNLSTW